MLWSIWATSIGLGAASLAVMVFLILRRVVQDRHAIERSTERKRLQSALIAFSGTRDNAALREVVMSTQPRVVLDGASEFLALLRGDEHADLVNSLVASGLADQAIKELRRGDEAGRVHAAEMLATLERVDAAPALLAMLAYDRATEARIAAALALAEIEKLPPLEEALKHIGADGRRSRRMVELFQRMQPERMSELHDLLSRQEASPLLRAAVIESLPASTQNIVKDLVREAAKDRSPEVVAAAIRATGRIGGTDAAEIVEPALTGADWQVRMEAAEVAGNLALTSLMDPIVTLLSDELWMVRYAAAKALEAMGDDGIRRLRVLAAEGSSRSQRTASLVLTEGPA